MRKLFFLLSVFALVTGLSQCNKPNLPVVNIGDKQHVVLNASWGDGGSKILQDGMGLKWKVGDVIIAKRGETQIGRLKCITPEEGVFEGYITKTTGNIRFTFGDQELMNQDGTIDDAVYLTSEDLEYNPEGDYGNVSMTMPYAVLKVDVSAFSKTGEKTMTITENGTPVASVVINSSTTDVFLAVDAPNNYNTSEELLESRTYGFSCDILIGSAEWKLVKNTFYTDKTETGAAIKIKPSEFTVGVDKKVYFSKGNLQYIGSAETPYWKFADNQYGYIGATEGQNNCEQKVDRDLFGWGTSTIAPLTDNLYKNYNPWLFSYGNPGNNYNYDGFGPSTNRGEESELLVSNGSDWGANPIINGGNTPNSWRTLTKGEWDYLINTRSVGGTGYGNTCAWATVEGVKGLIIFHDDYAGDKTGLTAIPDGCVFLPAAGCRELKGSGPDVQGVNNSGHYWSSTHHGAYDSYKLCFHSGGVYAFNDDNGHIRRYKGCSVRLVTDIK